MSKDPVPLKDLFRAAQEDDFNTVQTYLSGIQQESKEGDPSLNNTPIESLIEAKTNNSLFHYACGNGNLHACKLLFMCDGMATAFLNAINAFGHTPLFYAASSGHLAVVKWLVSNGADIDADYSEGNNVVPPDDLGIFTPLQIACFQGHESVATFLVECNAELVGSRRNGKTPLHFASAQNHPEIVKVLIEAGADIQAVDSEGKTPVDVAHQAILPLLLPDEYETQNENDNDIEGILERDDEEDEDDNEDEDDDEFESGRTMNEALMGVKKAFGAEIARNFQRKAWQKRVSAITEASRCFDREVKGKGVVKLFDGACYMIELALEDAVKQVASSCCTSLFRVAFHAVMSESEFHTLQFHQERPVLERIVTSLLLRGAASNEKESSDAISSLLFLIRKSLDLTRLLTALISKTIMSSSPSTLPASSSTGLSKSTPPASWRHQVVAIKLFNAIVSQYRMDEKASDVSFATAIKMTMLGIANASVQVRTASIELLVECLVIQCEEADMKGTVATIYEHVEKWYESLFKQQNQPLKPSIQAKINTGLKHALQKSKRLAITRNEEDVSAAVSRKRIESSHSTVFDNTSTVVDRNAGQRQEDDLPYAEPLQEQNRQVAQAMLECFGEKVTRCLFSNAWAPRVEALGYVQSLIASRELSFEKHQATTPSRLVRALQTTLLQALQDRVNAVYEAGVSLLMEISVALDRSVANSSIDVTIMHELVRPLIPRLLVKLGDAKHRLHVTTEDALLLLSRQSSCFGAVFLFNELIACDRNASVSTLSALYLTNKMTLILKLLLEFGVQETSGEDAPKGVLPIRNVLQLALQVCEHKDPTVRFKALEIVATTMQVARTATMPFLNALARSTRQKLISKLVERGVMESEMLMDEVDDYEVAIETARPGSARPPTASASSTKHRPALSNPSLSVSTMSLAGALQAQVVPLPYGTALTSEQEQGYAVLIQGFGDNLVRCLLDKAWAPREAAMREIERQVVGCASDRFLSDTALPKTFETLERLVDVLEIGLTDTVARVFQCALRLFQVIATEFLPRMGPSEPHHVDHLVEKAVGLVLQKLGDTKQRLRQDCFTLLYSMASLQHIGHARMIQMVAEKYEQLVSSSSALASSPLVLGELLRLLTVLVREAPTGEDQEGFDVSLVLTIVRPALENKHVDVRNAAIATYVTIYETTNGGTTTKASAVDLTSFLAGLKPSLQETITRNLVPLSKAPDPNGPETFDSPPRTQRSLGMDVPKLELICSAEITELLTSSSTSIAQRCLGVNKLLDSLVASTPDSKFKGAWETCCLLVKHLTLDGVPSVCLAAYHLLDVVIDPPSQPCENYAIPWRDWGVHLVLGSTMRSLVQQSGNENVRVRAKVYETLRLVAAKSTIGKNAVCNALLNAPEPNDGDVVTGRKLRLMKLRWQLTLRLNLLYEFLVEKGEKDKGVSSFRRNESTQGTTSADPLGVNTIVPFLGSAVTHPSQFVKTASIKIMRYLLSTCKDDVRAFIQSSSSPALKHRLDALMAEATASLDTNEGNNNNADHFHVDNVTCVRGSVASHFRRVAALRPPRSVPAERSELMVDTGILSPPNSAPGQSRRGASDDNDETESFGRSFDKQQESTHPIWLDDPQSGSNRGGKKKEFFDTISFDDNGLDESTFSIVVGGGTAGLMKARRKSTFRGKSSNNDARVSINF